MKTPENTPLLVVPRDPLVFYTRRVRQLQPFLFVTTPYLIVSSYRNI